LAIVAQAIRAILQASVMAGALSNVADTIAGLQNCEFDRKFRA
jgi:hypothetical protein